MTKAHRGLRSEGKRPCICLAGNSTLGNPSPSPAPIDRSDRQGQRRSCRWAVAVPAAVPVIQHRAGKGGRERPRGEEPVLPTWLYHQILGSHQSAEGFPRCAPRKGSLLHLLTTLHLSEASSAARAEISRLLPLRGCQEAQLSPQT